MVLLLKHLSHLFSKGKMYICFFCETSPFKCWQLIQKYLCMFSVTEPHTPAGEQLHIGHQLFLQLQIKDVIVMHATASSIISYSDTVLFAVLIFKVTF